MSGFEIIALKYDNEFCQYKNIKRNKLYKVIEKYRLFNKRKEELFSNTDLVSLKDITSIELIEEFVPTLYEGKNKNLSINVSAIVGKNGSGKSSLIELVMLFTYILSFRKNYLVANKTAVQESLELHENYKIELLYFLDGHYYLFHNFNRYFVLSKLIDDKWVRIEFKKDLFCFLIIMNYSIYGLNESKDKWLSPLFHRNDGYKTPITITPYRNNGNINVNNEYHLTQSRILTLFIEESLSNKFLIDNKTVTSLIFSYEPNKERGISEHSLLSIYKAFKIQGTDIFKIVERLLTNAYTNVSFIRAYNSCIDKYENYKPFKKEDYESHLFEYIVYKFLKIPYIYSEIFNNEFVISKDGNVFSEDLNYTLLRVFNHKSHVTLKLRQAINTLRFNYFEDIEWNWDINNNLMSINISSENFSKLINNPIIEDKFGYYNYSKVELTPGAFFYPDFIVENESKFYELSSGEQQTIHSIKAIQYHISNVDSVVNDGYSSINLFLDEIELYSHPEYQRKYLNRLIVGLNDLKLNKIQNINVIFSTHSPFILSDIPHYCLLQMKDGNAVNSTFEKTFGANLYDLLINNFFLENGTMGEVAEEYITDLITKINSFKRIDENSAKELRKAVDIISEDVIREKLNLMINDKTDDVDEKIKYLEKQINLLKKNKK